MSARRFQIIHETSDELRIRVPTARNPWISAFLIVWMAGVFVIGADQFPLRTINEMLGASLWATMLVVTGLSAAYRVIGRDEIRVRPEGIELVRDFHLFRYTRKFPVERIQDLELNDQEPSSDEGEAFFGHGQIHFTDGHRWENGAVAGRPVEFASGIDRDEARLLLSKIRALLNRHRN